MSNYTPGPWHIGPYQKILDSSGEIISVSGISMPSGHVPENHISYANARLIAAAPELYEMLVQARKCIAYCRDNHKDIQSGTGVPIEAIIDDVLAKAEGRTK